MFPKKVAPASTTLSCIFLKDKLKEHITTRERPINSFVFSASFRVQTVIISFLLTSNDQNIIFQFCQLSCQYFANNS